MNIIILYNNGNSSPLAFETLRYALSFQFIMQSKSVAIQWGNAAAVMESIGPLLGINDE